MSLLATRTFFPAFRLPFLRPLFAVSLAQFFLIQPRSWTWTIPTLQSLLEVFPPIVLAVPKKKTSHSRKNMRASGKGLKDKLNIVNCPACGAPKLAHHLCPDCYSTLNRSWKAKENKQGHGSYAGIPELHQDE